VPKAQRARGGCFSDDTSKREDILKTTSPGGTPRQESRPNEDDGPPPNRRQGRAFRQRRSFRRSMRGPARDARRPWDSRATGSYPEDTGSRSPVGSAGRQLYGVDRRRRYDLTEGEDFRDPRSGGVIARRLPPPATSSGWIESRRVGVDSGRRRRERNSDARCSKRVGVCDPFARSPARASSRRGRPDPTK